MWVVEIYYGAWLYVFQDKPLLPPSRAHHGWKQLTDDLRPLTEMLMTRKVWFGGLFENGLHQQKDSLPIDEKMTVLQPFSWIS
jgi:hypothetical protein